MAYSLGLRVWASRFCRLGGTDAAAAAAGEFAATRDPLY